jgi:hypothetical protein
MAYCALILVHLVYYFIATKETIFVLMAEVQTNVVSEQLEERLTIARQKKDQSIFMDMERDIPV